MIVFLRGEIVHKASDALHLDVGGVGYGLLMSSRSLSSVGALGDQVVVYTYLLPRENEINLYGFSTIEERDLFLLLVSVTGVGPKVALSALSTMSVPELQNAIALEDLKLISSAPGLGKKIASRIALELKDKFSMSETLKEDSINLAVEEDTVQGEVKVALTSMGFSAKEIELAFEKIDSDKEYSTEELLVKALTSLS